MSQENLDAVKAPYERWAAGDWSDNSKFDPHAVGVFPDPTPEAHYGLNALADYMRRFLESWADVRIEGTDYRDAGWLRTESGGGGSPTRRAPLCMESSRPWRDTSWAMPEEKEGSNPLFVRTISGSRRQGGARHLRERARRVAIAPRPEQQGRRFDESAAAMLPYAKGPHRLGRRVPLCMERSAFWSALASRAKRGHEFGYLCVRDPMTVAELFGDERR
jgi:hypothetical protein